MTTDTTFADPNLATSDPVELRQLAQSAMAGGRNEEAASLLKRALELEPGFFDARFNLAWTLHRLDRPAEVIEHLRPLLALEPDEPKLQNLLATQLERIGQYDEAIEVYRGILRQDPDLPIVLVMLANLLSIVGRTDESVEAYRRAIALKPRLGDAWWGLANLKTAALTSQDIAALEAALDHQYLTQDDAAKLNFALGKALEDAGGTAEAFRRYSEGNALRHEDLRYEPSEIEQFVDRAEALFTPAFFADRVGGGCPASDPIFIVGMPRSGSTLVDQILSSHPEVEGTAELRDLLFIARRLRQDAEARGSSYPAALADLSESQRSALGAEYIERTRPMRKTDRPFFIDKTPNNWAHVGLIQLILPNAKIVDVRRHPLGCCLSNFKQYFSRGQEFSYALDDLGRYYRDYVRFSRHFDAVLPGRVHRVIYERLVEEIEPEVRRLLDYLSLDFDPAVLRFYENERAVPTPSAEQVRRPINRQGMEGWQPFEPYLGPLKEALGPVLDSYPEPPPI